jgi:hypothetical protein
MGDLQDPIDGGTLVPFFRPKFVGIIPYVGLNNRPYIWWLPPINRILKFPLNNLLIDDGFKLLIIVIIHF